MKISTVLLVLGLACSSTLSYARQSPGVAVAGPPAGPQTAAGPDTRPEAKPDAKPAGPAAPIASAEVPASASDLLKPALTDLSQTLGGLKLEKWKGGTVRAEAGANVGSIQKDIQGALPDLLAEADASAGALSQLLAVSRHVDALYDVLLRVVDGARVAAPGEQVTQLQQTIARLQKARQAMDSRIEDTAATREKQIADLQVALKTQAAPVCPVVAAPATPAPAAPKKTVKKKKPAAPKAASPLPSGAAGPP